MVEMEITPCLYCPITRIEAHQLCSLHYQRWKHRRPMEITKIAQGWLTDQGYRQLSLPNGKMILEHRKIMQEYLGRELTREEVVHHKNGIKDDNRLENLEVMDTDTHMKLHHKHTPIKRLCEWCGIIFIRNSKLNRRKYRTCSHICGTSLLWAERRFVVQCEIETEKHDVRNL